jgi:photosystem II stability/assembly factor-like uncharacterized protein
MSVLVATSHGCHVFTPEGAHVTELDGHAVDAVTAGPRDSWVAVVDRREVWQRPGSGDGSWTPLASTDVELVSLCAHRGSLFAGAYDATLFRLDDGALVEIPGFTAAPGRDEWHAVGPPLNVRSMSSTADDGALLANVHVGGILRSTDGGATWAPTLPVDDDVHEVRAHPSDPSVAFAAAAVGLCHSEDGGATWAVETDGLPHTYARAVAFGSDGVLVSISDGPFARRCGLYTRASGGGPLTRVAHGLPDDGLQGNVDTACLAALGRDVALADGGGDLWERHGDGAWVRTASAVGEVRAVVLV